MRLNIACGPNVFPFAGWINYDRMDLRGYLNEMRGADAELIATAPESQRRLILFLQGGGDVEFHVQNVSTGLPQHAAGSIDGIYLGQMIEHFNPIYETPNLLAECLRLLKPGGVLRVTTPDLDLLVDAYKAGEMGRFAADQPEFYRGAVPSAQLAYLMYGACGPGCNRENYEGHFCLYTRDSLGTLLRAIGFGDPVFYGEGGKSRDPVMAEQVVDVGLSHSFITEVVKT